MPVTEIAGNEVGIFVTFISPEKPVEVSIGISYIDERQAATNLQKESNAKNF